MALKKYKYLCAALGILLILCLILSFTLTGQGNKQADAYIIADITGNGAADTISEILNLNRTSSSRGSLVFNGQALYDLYSKLTGKAVASLDDVKDIMANSAYDKSSTYAQNVSSIHYGLNAEDIRKINNGNNIDVVMNGLVWEVATVTTTGSDSDRSSGDVVLTLLLKAPLDEKTSWGKFYSTDFTFKYPPTVYSASLIRAKLLNGKDYLGNEVQYTTDGTALTTLDSADQIASYPFGIYTDVSNSSNITQFLVQPKDVLYQQNENLYSFTLANTTDGSNIYNASNDASKNILPSDQWATTDNWQIQYRTAGNTVSGFTYTSADPGYFDWANDFIWLPSITEIGVSRDSGSDTLYLSDGLWALDSSQRNTPTTYGAWLRSGRTSTADRAYFIEENGRQYVVTQTSSSSTSSATSGLCIRPALNLNLSLVDESSETRIVPDDVTVEYTGSGITLKKAADMGAVKWYNSTAFDNGMDSVEYWDGEVKISEPIEPGTYTVKMTIKDTEKYFWYNNTDAEQDITLTITTRKIAFPKWYNGSENSQVCLGGADVTFRLYKDDDWVNDFYDICGKDLFADIADVTITPSTTVTSAAAFDKTKWEFTAKEVATYTVTFAIKDSMKKYFDWSGAPSSYQLTFEVTPWKLAFPTWYSDSENSQVYNGGNNVTFRLYYNSDLITELNDACGLALFTDIADVTISPSMNTSFDDVRWRISAQEAGDYTITFDIKSEMQKYFAWSNAPSGNELKFTVEKSPVVVSLTGADYTTEALKGDYGGTLSAIIEVDSQYQPHAGKQVSFYVQAKADALPPEKISDTYTITANMLNENRWINVMLDLSELETDAVYNISLIYTSSEYDLQLKTTNTIEVERVVNSVLTWYLYADGVRQPGYYCDVTTSQDNVDFTKTITYSGKTYKFQITVPSGYAIDTRAGSEGYEVIPGKGSANRAAGKNADTYTTKVTLYRLDDDQKTPLVYSINWEIEQALFDLSKTVWLYDGQVPYNGGARVEETLDPKTIPDGLIPVYGGTYYGTTVNFPGRAEVESFTLTSEYEGNYKVPDPDDPTSYTGAGVFEWEKAWTIVPAVIDTSAWQLASHPDPDKDFNIRVLVDPAAELAVRYLYYETDTSGRIIDENKPLDVNDLVWSSDTAKYYVAKVELAITTGGYVLSNPNAQSKLFIVGDFGTEITHIQVQPSTTVFDYNTQSRYISVRVTSGPSLTNNYFDIEYYDGFTKLSAGPVDVGTYNVVISLKSQYLTSYTIDGDNTFTMTINPTVITPVWSTTTPPALKLDYGQINAIDYVIMDMQQNPVTFADLQAGQKYQIQALIKPEYRRNIRFDTASLYDTEWKEFEATSNGMIDPFSPTNPSYEQTNPDEVPDTSNPSDPSNPGTNDPTNPTTPTKTDVTLEWSNTNPPSLSAEQTALLKPTYTFTDSDGNTVDKDNLEKGKDYTVTVSFSTDINNKYNIKGETSKTFTYKENVQLEWDTTKNPPVLVIPPELEDVLNPDDIEYEYYDKEGNPLNPDEITDDTEIGNVVVKLPDGFEDEYVFVDKNGEEVDMTQPLDPYADVEEPSFLDKLLGFLQDYWQVLVSGVALILIIAFTAKGMSYAGKRRKIKKQIKKNYTPAYAFALFTAGEKLWGIEYKIWTILAFTLLGVAVLSLIYMLLEKRGFKKAEEELADAKAEYARNPAAFAPAAAAAGAVGATAQYQPQSYAEDSRASRKHDREIERLEEELRRRDEELKRREDKKSDREMENLKEEMRRRDEEMKMMFMSMLGNQNAATQFNAANADSVDGASNNANPAYGAGAPFGFQQFGYPPYGMPYGAPYGQIGGTNITVDAEHIKSAITETIAAIMPAMQAMLPQQAGTSDEVVKMLADEIKATKEESRKNDETVRRLIEKSEKSDERMEKLISRLMEKEQQPAAPANNEALEQMMKSQETLMRNQEVLIAKLLEKGNSADVKANNAAMEQLAKNQELLVKQMQDMKAQPADKRNNEAMEQLAKNQEMLAKHVKDLSEKTAEPKVVEKIVEKPIEKIVEVPVEKVVEKVVEKKVEVPVEKIVEKVVEKPVEKIVKVPAEKKGVSVSERTPRLTIDEAYAKLSKEQKKFFDKLHDYALSKEKCKEKKSTYYILLGQSSVNPLIKLTIKKDTTVALFKMEDEYFKDLRKNAGSDGTKMKVKETELIVSDEQAFATAKEMIDLREDQIDRYSEFLKEQRSFKK